MSDTERTLFKGGTVVTMDDNVSNLVAGDVLVEGEHIVAVQANIRAGGAEVIDATGNIVLPGLIDAHHHSWLGVMRRLMPDVDDLFAYTGIAMFAALAIGAPVGMTLYHQWGLQAAMIACVIAPMLAIVSAYPGSPRLPRYISRQEAGRMPAGS